MSITNMTLGLPTVKHRITGGVNVALPKETYSAKKGRGKGLDSLNSKRSVTDTRSFILNAY